MIFNIFNESQYLAIKTIKRQDYWTIQNVFSQVLVKDQQQFLLQMLIRRLLYNYLSMQKQIHQIKLTQNQTLLFRTLLQYKNELGLKTVMRVAGGWVRDKIMGNESHDIDITLDDMKGEQFVILLKKHAESKNQKISSFGVTKFNPDLSKHLETATAKIHGQNIDFVNLRSQSYNQNSRIPQIQMGTPQTDAKRRDFTINSLFYNLDTQQIEDWTQKGISDIYDKIIRTPLAPLQTFKDDPLRVLRCFRFKARFNFRIEQTLYSSLLDHNVHEALKTKISKQRIGIELAGMLKANFPLTALEQVLKYKFWSIIFEIPANSDLKDLTLIESIPELGFNLVAYGLKSIEHFSLKTQKHLLILEQQQVQDKRQRYSEDELKFQILLSLITLPYQGYIAPQGKKFLPLPQYIARNELKYSAKQAKFTQKTGQLAFQLEKILAKGKNNSLKICLARWLRQAEQKWQIAIHCLNAWREVKGKINQLEMEPIALRDWIFEQNLQDTYLTESFIDGTFLTKRGKKGPIIKIILDNTVLWRILNPKTDKQEFLELFQKNIGFFQNQNAYQ